MDSASTIEELTSGLQLIIYQVLAYLPRDAQDNFFIGRNNSFCNISWWRDFISDIFINQSTLYRKL